MQTRVLFVLSVFAIASVCCCEELHGPQWAIGDTWVIIVNIWKAKSPPKMDREIASGNTQANVIFKHWIRHIRPKGISIEDWQKSKEFRKWANDNDIVVLDPDSPYSPWMKESKRWFKVDEHILWSRWKFEVLSDGFVRGNSKYTKLKVVFDGIEGVEAKHNQNDQERFAQPESYFVLWMRAENLAIAKCEVRSVKDNSLLRTQEFAVDWTYCVEDVALGLPFYAKLPDIFPVLQNDSCDPSGTNLQWAQRTDRLKDGRWVIVSVSHRIDMDKTNTSPDDYMAVYAKHFWRSGLPWWEEAYVTSWGGIRSQLRTVNGKDVTLSVEPVDSAVVPAPPENASGRKPKGVKDAQQK